MIKKLLFLVLLSIGLFAQFPALSQNSKDDQLAIMFFQEKDYEKAASIFLRLYEEKPSNYYYTYLIYCYLESQQYKEAEKLVRKQIKMEPATKRYAVDLGYVYKRQDEPAKAQKQYDEILQNLPAERNSISEIGNAFLSRRESELAVKTYMKGRQLIPDYPFNMELANIYMSMGDINQMTEEYLNYVDYDITKINYVQDRMQDVLANDPDGTKNENFRKAILKRIQKYPDRTYYSEMLIWYSVQQKDFDMAYTQAKSIDKRLGANGQKVYELAKLCISNNSLDVADEALRYVISKGKEAPFYMSSRIELLNVAYLRLTGNYTKTQGQLIQLEKDYETTLAELGYNTGTIHLVRNLAHLEAFYLANTDKAIDILNQALEIPAASNQQKADCKLELGDIYLFAGEVWEATLLYSQVDKVFKNDPLGHEAKFRNAKLSFYIGEFNWAKAQLDVLKAATSKLICNDAMELSLMLGDNLFEDSTATGLKVYARAKLAEYQNKDDIAWQILDSIALLNVPHSLNDEVLFTKAGIAVKKSQFTVADSLYQLCYTTYPEDILADNALFKRAELNDIQLNNKTVAMELYQEILTKFPGSLFTVDARKRFRALRGDSL
jgi:tetratricopeptide (TPR) repeat protein